MGGVRLHRISPYTLRPDPSPFSVRAVRSIPHARHPTQASARVRGSGGASGRPDRTRLARVRGRGEPPVTTSAARPLGCGAPGAPRQRFTRAGTAKALTRVSPDAWPAPARRRLGSTCASRRSPAGTATAPSSGGRDSGRRASYHHPGSGRNGPRLRPGASMGPSLGALAGAPQPCRPLGSKPAPPPHRSRPSWRARHDPSASGLPGDAPSGGRNPADVEAAARPKAPRPRRPAPTPPKALVSSSSYLSRVEFPGGA